MPNSYFFVRLVANRPDFAMTMTPQEQATMGEHIAWLHTHLKAGKLVVAGPVMDPAGGFGMAVFEGESLEEVSKLLESDPAKAIGKHSVFPMGGTPVVRPAR